MVLVAGINTGTAKVKVRLRERAWQGVEPDIIKLLVVENMILQPSMDVYILPLPPTEVKGHQTGSHPTRHQLNYCVRGCVTVCDVWIVTNLTLHLFLQNLLCRACFHDDMTSDSHMPDCPLLTQTNNHNIQVHKY